MEEERTEAKKVKAFTYMHFYTCLLIKCLKKRGRGRHTWVAGKGKSRWLAFEPRKKSGEVLDANKSSYNHNSEPAKSSFCMHYVFEMNTTIHQNHETLSEVELASICT